jgi:hypothetical protein
MKLRWGQLGGQLGIGYCLAGVALILLGWNGAASYDRVESQMPYLISGGLAGLALVIIGAGLLVVQAQRQNRAALQTSITDLREAIDRLIETTGAASAPGAPTVSGGAPEGAVGVLAGPSSYHRPNCRLIEGQSGLIPMMLTAAHDSGLTPCRICSPGEGARQNA